MPDVPAFVYSGTRRLMSPPPLRSFFSHPQLTADDYLCSGYRADVYGVRYQQRDAVAKVYKPRFVEKYQKRYKTDIARFEFERNTAFYEIDALRPYCARPFAYFSSHDQRPAVFIQEHVRGMTLEEFVKQRSYLPRAVVEVGYLIVSVAGRYGLHDLDMHSSNVFVVRDELGWKPMVCDFNMMPRHKAAPNPLMALSFFFKLRKPNYRDYGNLRNWRHFPLR